MEDSQDRESEQIAADNGNGTTTNHGEFYPDPHSGLSVLPPPPPHPEMYSKGGGDLDQASPCGPSPPRQNGHAHSEEEFADQEVCGFPQDKSYTYPSDAHFEDDSDEEEEEEEDGGTQGREPLPPPLSPPASVPGYPYSDEESNQYHTQEYQPHPDLVPIGNYQDPPYDNEMECDNGAYTEQDMSNQGDFNAQETDSNPYPVVIPAPDYPSEDYSERDITHSEEEDYPDENLSPPVGQIVPPPSPAIIDTQNIEPSPEGPLEEDDLPPDNGGSNFTPIEAYDQDLGAQTRDDIYPQEQENQEDVFENQEPEQGFETKQEEEEEIPEPPAPYQPPAPLRVEAPAVIEVNTNENRESTSPALPQGGAESRSAQPNIPPKEEEAGEDKTVRDISPPRSVPVELATMEEAPHAEEQQQPLENEPGPAHQDEPGIVAPGTGEKEARGPDQVVSCEDNAQGADISETTVLLSHEQRNSSHHDKTEMHEVIEVEETTETEHKKTRSERCSDRLLHCLSLVPCASLVAWILLLIGLGGFAGSLLIGMQKTRDILEFDDLFWFLEYTVTGVVVGMFVLGTSLLCVGHMSTEPTSRHLFHSTKKNTCGQVLNVIMMVLTYLLGVAWVVVTSLMGVPIFLLVVLLVIKDKVNCIDLQNYALPVKKFCADDLEDLAEKGQNLIISYIVAYASSLLVLLSLVHFLIVISANIAHLKDRRLATLNAYAESAGETTNSKHSIVDTTM